MEIGIEVGKLAQPRDGIGNYVYYLIKALAKLDAENRYWLLGPRSADALQRVEATLGELPGDFRLLSWASPSIPPLDVFHGPAHRLAIELRVPQVFTLHDLTFLSHPEGHTIENRTHCLQGLIAALQAEATFISVSSFTAGEAMALLDLPAERIEIVPHGVASFFSPANGPVDEVRGELAREFGLDRDYILFVGSLEPRKNVLRLVKAYGLLPESLKEGHALVLAGGKGWLNADLHDLINKHRGRLDIRQLGYVDDRQLRSLYRGAKVFAYPSLIEGFGMPALEAMACGAPVLTAATTSLPEVVGEAAYGVDPYDTDAIRQGLQKMLSDDSLRLGLRERGFARAGEFSWHNAAARTLDVYRQVL